MIINQGSIWIRSVHETSLFENENWRGERRSLSQSLKLANKKLLHEADSIQRIHSGAIHLLGKTKLRKTTAQSFPSEGCDKMEISDRKLSK